MHWRQSGINSAGARRGFSGILLQNTYKYTNLKQIPGDGRKSGGASAPPAPPSLAPMPIKISSGQFWFSVVAMIGQKAHFPSVSAMSKVVQILVYPDSLSKNPSTAGSR